MIHRSLFLALLPIWFAAPPAAAQPGQQNTGLPTVKLTIGSASLTAEVAATERTREIGLMNRFSLASDSGMLFVFEGSRPLSFWMRNTYIPLSIAFIDANGTILNIEDMTPKDERSTWSAGAAMYALEMRKGWFAQKGVRAGARVEGLNKAPVPR